MRALGFVGDKFQCAVSTESVRNGWRLVLRTHSLILLPDEREREREESVAMLTLTILCAFCSLSLAADNIVL
jgi:hypothetical protein